MTALNFVRSGKAARTIWPHGGELAMRLGALLARFLHHHFMTILRGSISSFRKA
jgi:hypothetical protein